MVFPEKAASTPPLEQQNATSTPPFASVSGRNQIEEKAASDELKGGEDAHKRRHPDRSNLKESNLSELTLGNLEVEKNGRAAAPAQLSSHSRVTAPRELGELGAVHSGDLDVGRLPRAGGREVNVPTRTILQWSQPCPTRLKIRL
jgi:hypothetical protein